MSTSPIRGNQPLVAVPRPAPKPEPKAEQVAAVPTEKVSISPAAQKAAGGDVDRDGDSH
jgi:hypothetical protein